MADVYDEVPTRRKGRPPFKYGKKAHVRLFKNKAVDYHHRMSAIQRVAEVGMSAFLDGYCPNATRGNQAPAPEQQGHQPVILNGFRKCQLIEGAGVEVVLPGDSLDVSDIADLMADSAVQETIDPAKDIDAIDAISSAEIVLL
ncbi:hypothetical protein H310_14739 [Aphanomyces invadans]|uniref:Uncharacterized protein n=1 Tax=Aphanomyces invadans TaxID=157072 RepID=A0A024T942_9STRA|nr:hypothetical protein H310_14739 [Aphanomyces invadans]ETV90499.1 hypothetical protein H310_14739 [Aphanomyces invadans]|eukprot:XP_008880887.1 hypothetical protein H310_14739 [Aphanomyces invadans]